MELEEGNIINITQINCGKICNNRLSAMGINIGSEMEIISLHPSRGPVVVRIGEAEYAIGSGMFQKLEYEIIK